MTDEMKRVAAEPCRCVTCWDCKGSGSYWVDWRGHYVGNRGDDLDEMEYCDSCGGSGITETCDRCQLLDEMDNQAA